MRLLVSPPLLLGLLCGAVAVAGCKKDYPQCETYVELAMKCDADLTSAPAGERDVAKLVLGGMCEEAFNNDTSSVEGDTRKMVSEVYAEIRGRASCVAKAATCAQYTDCTD